MYRYFIKIPGLVKKIFPNYIWSLPAKEKVIYLTFDDGPHPQITNWVLDELKSHNALATFFCIGKNVQQFAECYNRILNEGHAVGNHTYSHLNGWKTNNTEYLADVFEAAKCIHSNFFRPPYGRIKTKQAKQIQTIREPGNVKIIMWDVLSGDFDSLITPQQCFLNVVENISPGSIVVFHDSEKAFTNLKYALPKVLDHLKTTGYIFKKIEV